MLILIYCNFIHVLKSNWKVVTPSLNYITYDLSLPGRWSGESFNQRNDKKTCLFQPRKQAYVLTVWVVDVDFNILQFYSRFKIQLCKSTKVEIGDEIKIIYPSYLKQSYIKFVSISFITKGVKYYTTNMHGRMVTSH
mgnify:CR=1 FL=1